MSFNIPSHSTIISYYGISGIALIITVYASLVRRPWPRFNIKMTSYLYRKSHCGDKTILRPSYLHNGIFYTGKMISLYWIKALVSITLPDVVPAAYLVQNGTDEQIDWIKYGLMYMIGTCDKNRIIACNFITLSIYPCIQDSYRHAPKLNYQVRSLSIQNVLAQNIYVALVHNIP